MGDILNSCISKSLLRSDKAYEYDHVSDRLQKAVDPPPLKWSAPIVRKRRIRNGNQATQTGRDCHEAAAG
jgi:hypothetical protein